MNKKPPELHLIDGTVTRSREMPVMLPETIRCRIPVAAWGEDPSKWDRQKFIEDTADFLFKAYGIGNAQDQHILSVLADHMDTYVSCVDAIRKAGPVTRNNNGATVGPNPYLSVRNKTTTLIIQLMNELGLTPRGRLSTSNADDDSPLDKLMRGPKG